MIFRKSIIIITLFLFLFAPSLLFIQSSPHPAVSSSSLHSDSSNRQVTNILNYIPHPIISSLNSINSYSLFSSLAISIGSNSDLSFWSSSGNGSSTNPYIIQNRTFTSTISITNTNAYFILRYISVTYANTGIDLQNVTHGTFTYLNISFNTIGVSSLDSFNNTFSLNFLKNNQAAAFYIVGSNNNSFIDNIISNPSPNYKNIIYISHYGINLQNSTNNIIIGNNFTNSGIVQGSESISLSIQSLVQNNTINGKPILYLQNSNNLSISESLYGQILAINSSDISIINQDFSNATFGIEIFFCSNILFSFNSVVNTSYGIISLYSSKISFLNNNVFSTIYAIYIEESNDSRILSNLIYENLNGIDIFSSNFIEIGSNFINNNTYVGIYTNYMLFSNISFNLLNLNFIGIDMNLSNFNNISSNNITNNTGSGMEVFSVCTNNTLIYNNFSYNHGIGLFFTNDTIPSPQLASKNNLVYLNTFISNNDGNNIITMSKSNFFDNETFGNYWDTYRGVDRDNDGIGDTPAYVPYSQYDYFPLMNQPIKGKAIEPITSYISTSSSTTIESQPNTNVFANNPFGIEPIIIFIMIFTGGIILLYVFVIKDYSKYTKSFPNDKTFKQYLKLKFKVKKRKKRNNSLLTEKSLQIIDQILEENK